MSRIFIDAGGVAEILGLPDRGAFLRRHHDLQRDHGFPLPMPQSRRPLIWRASQVNAWLDEQGVPAGDNGPEFVHGTNVVRLMKEAASV